jgi:hypothetical protein
MSRKTERILVRLLGCWQVIDGVITILLYSMYKRNQLSGVTNLSNEHAKAIDAAFGNIFIFIGMFGTLLIGCGLFNLVVAKRYIKDNQMNQKVGIWLIALSIFSYFSMDLLSVVLGMSAAVILLSKNKGIRRHQELTTS